MCLGIFKTRSYILQTNNMTVVGSICIRRKNPDVYFLKEYFILFNIFGVDTHTTESNEIETILE